MSIYHCNHKQYFIRFCFHCKSLNIYIQVCRSQPVKQRRGRGVPSGRSQSVAVFPSGKGALCPLDRVGRVIPGYSFAAVKVRANSTWTLDLLKVAWKHAR